MRGWGAAHLSSPPPRASLAFSQLTATVLTLPRFLFTPQEARELLPPLPPQEVTAGRVSHAGACCPGPAAGLRTARPSEAEPRTGGSPGRVVSLFHKEGPSAKTRGCECGRGRSSGRHDGGTGAGAVRSPGCGTVGCCLGQGPPICRGDAAVGVQTATSSAEESPWGEVQRNGRRTTGVAAARVTVGGTGQFPRLRRQVGEQGQRWDLTAFCRLAYSPAMLRGKKESTTLCGR